MPVYKTIYDKETGEALVRDSLTAAEAIANDRDRYSYKPWKIAPGVSARDDARARKAAKAAKEAPEQVADEPTPETEDAE